MTSISDSLEQLGMTATNTFSPRFSKCEHRHLARRPAHPFRAEVGVIKLVLADFPLRPVDVPSEDLSAQVTVVVAGGVAVHAADVRHMRCRQVSFEA